MTTKANNVPGWSGMCPNCRYIGDEPNCSCVWTLRRVAEGKGSDPDVVKNAQTILKRRES